MEITNRVTTVTKNFNEHLHLELHSKEHDIKACLQLVPRWLLLFFEWSKSVTHSVITF